MMRISIITIILPLFCSFLNGAETEKKTKFIGFGPVCCQPRTDYFKTLKRESVQAGKVVQGNGFYFNLTLKYDGKKESAIICDSNPEINIIHDSIPIALNRFKNMLAQKNDNQESIENQLKNDTITFAKDYYLPMYYETETTKCVESCTALIHEIKIIKNTAIKNSASRSFISVAFAIILITTIVPLLITHAIPAMTKKMYGK